MKCDICGSDDNVFFQMNNSESEIWLCQACALSHGYAFNTQNASLSFSSEKLKNNDTSELNKCSFCGTTQEQFATNSKLGCSCCAKIFKAQIIATLRRNGRSLEYIGKSPHFTNAASKIKIAGNSFSRSELIISLEKAINEENFEEAARIRDKLKISNTGINSQ